MDESDLEKMFVEWEAVSQPEPEAPRVRDIIAKARELAGLDLSDTLDEVANETRLLENQGHKRLLMLMGEDSTQCTLDHFLSAIETAYATKTESGEIRRINVEIAPLSVEDFRRLRAAKIGTYVVFQETYHKPTYAQVHPSGRKADYNWRVTAMDRAVLSRSKATYRSAVVYGHRPSIRPSAYSGLAEYYGRG